MGSIVITIPDDDPDTFEIILKVVHGLTRKVPRIVDSNMNVETATLVDYYQMHEAVEYFSDTWILQYHGPNRLPSYGNTLSQLWASWVFQDRKAFKWATRRLVSAMNDDPEWARYQCP